MHMPKKLPNRILSIAVLIGFLFASSPVTYVYASKLPDAPPSAPEDSSSGPTVTDPAPETPEQVDAEGGAEGEQTPAEDSGDSEESVDAPSTGDAEEAGGETGEPSDAQQETPSDTTGDTVDDTTGDAPQTLATPQAPTSPESEEGDDDAQTPETTPSDTTADTTIDNGNVADATNTVDASSTTGNNTVTTAPPTPDSEATQTPEAPAEETPQAETATTTETTTESDAPADPETPKTPTDGEAAVGGSAIIETGDSLSAVNLVNLLNTNIVNSDGLILFLQSLSDAELASLDLRDYAYLFDGSGAPAEGCGEVACGTGTGSTVIRNANDASIINTVEVNASTGNNDATAGTDALITTGDAYASANIINIANTNIVGSKYLILNFDSFGDYSGDIVFPGITALQNFFNSQSGPQGSSVTVDNTNTADVSNTVGTSANTGGNSAVSSSGNAVVQTGNAATDSSILNLLNTNLFSSGGFSVVLRVHGNWTGNVFSLPDGVSFGQSGPSSFAFGLSGSGSGTSTLAGDSVVVQNTNNAHIENNVLVSADTGGNTAIGPDGAIINTGDAYASANITNIANTNIIGQNWILAIINIFGDYSGNVSFGKPDLWVGERVEAPRDVGNGSKLNYKYTLTNNGDVTATGVVLKDLFNSGHVLPLDYDGEATQAGDTITWTIGSLAPGETVEVGYTGKVHSAPYGETEITNKVSLSGYEPDENMDDNTDSATVIARVTPPQQHSQRLDSVLLSEAPDASVLSALTIERSNSAVGTVRTGEAVTYKLHVTNTTDRSLYNVVLTDDLRSPEGAVIHTESFPLGEVLPNEKINIEYTVLYNDTFETGVYSNSATVSGSESPDGAVLISPASPDRIYFEKPAPVVVPAITKSKKEKSAALELPPLIPVAEASAGDDSDTYPSFGSFQGASIGMLGLTTNHLLLIILLLYLAYEARRRHLASR